MSPKTFSTLVWISYALFSGCVFYFIWKLIEKKTASPKKAATLETNAPQTLTYQGRKGLEANILREGAGVGAKNRDMLTVHYTAFLTTGQQVDSSRERGQTLTFKLGTAAVIDGWDEALKGAKVGEIRKITVPPHLAYGKKGTKKVPPNATIIFEVELLKIEN